MQIEPGVYTALVTLTKGKKSEPLNEIDYERTWELVDHQKKAGVKGIVLLGTTGQSATILGKERKEFLRNMLPYVRRAGLLPIIGCGSNSTQVAIEESEFVADIGSDIPLLHVTGYYNCPPQEGLLAHFGAVADSVPNPIILYNVPGRTANYLTPDTILALARKYPNIVGLKQAVDFGKNNSDHHKDTVHILEHAPKGFSIFSGEDNLVAKGMQFGFKGVISASANIRPHPFVKIVEAGLEGKLVEAFAAQEGVDPVVAAVFNKKNPIPLHLMFGSHPRLPLTNSCFTEGDKRSIQNALDACPSPDAYFNRKVA
jgi:4-hydroxy-tetrahydrodipicolinate synthase